MKPLSEKDMIVAKNFLRKETRKDKKFWLDCWRLMANIHELGGNMDAIMFFI